MSKITKAELVKIVEYQHGLLEDIYRHGRTWVRNYACYRKAVEDTVALKDALDIRVFFEDGQRRFDLSNMKVPEK